MNDPQNESDLATRSTPFMRLWGWPILILFALNFVTLPLVWLTLIAVILTFVPEMLFGKYRTR